MFTLMAVNRGSEASLQWQKSDGAGNFANLSGETTETLSFDPSEASDSGEYRLAATNDTGTTYSRTTLVFVRSNVSLGDALEQPTLSWTTGGTFPWRGLAPGPSFDGIDAAECGPPTTTGISWLKTTIVGPANFGFNWKTSSVHGLNTLTLWIDGVQTDFASGEVDWTPKEYLLGAGSHEIGWRYTKTIVFSEGSDQAWLDNVRVVTATNPPSLNPSYPEDGEFAAGSEALLFAFSIGDLASYQRYKLTLQGFPVELPGETDSVLSIPSFQASDAGRYVMYATNSAGTRQTRIATISLQVGANVSLVDALDDAGRV